MPRRCSSTRAAAAWVQAIFQELLTEHGAKPLTEGSDAAVRYLARHDHAMRFALANRALLAHRFAGELGASVRLVSDVAHNMVTRERFEGEPAWTHRKGAASALEAQAAGALMIPARAARRAISVRVAGDTERAAWSVAHGAGRRWQRGYAKSRLSHKYRVEDLARTDLGGRVICEDRELLYDEAPQAYKDIAQVIADLENLGLVRTIAVYRPVLTYKVRRAEHEGRAGMSNALAFGCRSPRAAGRRNASSLVAKLRGGRREGRCEPLVSPAS